MYNIYEHGRVTICNKEKGFPCKHMIEHSELNET